MTKPKRVSHRIREAVEAQSVASPVRQLLLDALDRGWTVPSICEAARLSANGLYKIIHDPDGLCRRSTLHRLRDTITSPPPTAAPAELT